MNALVRILAFALLLAVPAAAQTVQPSGGGGVTGSAGIACTGSACSLSLANATFQSTTLTPTGTASVATPIMMGLGSTCKLTPVYSGRIRVKFDGNLSNSGAAASFTQARFGTGTAPANAAAAAGTIVGVQVNAFSPVGTASVPFSNGGIITGLTVGTAYWFDQGTSVQSSGTATILAVTCSIDEF